MPDRLQQAAGERIAERVQRCQSTVSGSNHRCSRRVDEGLERRQAVINLLWGNPAQSVAAAHNRLAVRAPCVTKPGCRRILSRSQLIPAGVLRCVDELKLTC